MKLLLALFLSTPLWAAEIQFAKKQITLGKEKLKVELAETYEEQERGLMFREKLSDNEGMLFVFPEEKITTFWMKNTLVPLSLGYFDKKKTLKEIKDLEPASPMDTNPPTYSNKKPAKYVLEVPKGWFLRKKIKVGESFRF